MSSSPKCSLPLSFCDQNIVGLWLSLLCMLHSPSNVILVLRTLNNNNNKCTSLINITMQRHNPLVQLEPTFSVLHPISVSSSRLGISFLYVTSMNLLPSLSCSTVRGRQSQITDWDHITDWDISSSSWTHRGDPRNWVRVSWSTFLIGTFFGYLTTIFELIRCVTSGGKAIVADELERIWKEAFVTCFKPEYAQSSWGKAQEKCDLETLGLSAGVQSQEAG